MTVDIHAERLRLLARGTDLLERNMPTRFTRPLRRNTGIRNGADNSKSKRAATEDDIERKYLSAVAINTALKHQLCAAAVYAVALEDELAGLRPAMPAAPRQPLDARTRERLRKVSALWLQGGTPGERAAALKRLADAATARGYTLPRLLLECGIDGPASWTIVP